MQQQGTSTTHCSVRVHGVKVPLHVAHEGRQDAAVETADTQLQSLLYQSQLQNLMIAK